jgi:hypothetical protein
MSKREDAPGKEYMRRLSLFRALNGALHPGLYITSVFHDNSCPLLRGLGECSCDPEIIVEDYKTGKKFSIDANGIGHPVEKP